ncbi:hypothetical protein MC885_015324 [Smutsia gigantea]|nr:hypothetical protein MC885_015324 [Smutsia gigantea]
MRPTSVSGAEAASLPLRSRRSFLEARNLRHCSCVPCSAPGPRSGPSLGSRSSQELISWPGRAACPLMVARMFGDSPVQSDLLVLPSSLSPFQPDHNQGQCSRFGNSCWQNPYLGARAVFR